MAFEISIGSIDEAAPDEPRPVLIRSGALVFTRLMRPGSNEADDHLRAPPAQLAFWLIDNWWRLRWEGIPPAGMSEEWRLAHDLSSIGGGYVWPRLSIWGEDPRIGLISRSDPAGVVGPIRYLTDALCFIEAASFEVSVDEFLDGVAKSGAGLTSDSQTLAGQIEVLRNERGDAEIADWRRMEARLGFDVDEAPDSLVQALGKIGRNYDAPSVEEAAMGAPGVGALDALRAAIEIAEGSRIECDFSSAVRASTANFAAEQGSPWSLAEAAAANLRTALGIARGPIRNKALGELVSTRAESFRSTSASPGLSYGLRLKWGARGNEHLATRSRWSHDRRFEIARALGDAIWTEGGRLGPLSAAGTARQKFQRAFAQSLLCPFDDLIAYLGDGEITDGAVYAAARHFHVSERLVRSVLVNKHVLGRERLAPGLGARADGEELQDQLEAA